MAGSESVPSSTQKCHPLPNSALKDGHIYESWFYSPETFCISIIKHTGNTKSKHLLCLWSKYMKMKLHNNREATVRLFHRRLDHECKTSKSKRCHLLRITARNVQGEICANSSSQYQMVRKKANGISLKSLCLYSGKKIWKLNKTHICPVYDQVTMPVKETAKKKLMKKTNKSQHCY